MFYLLIIGSNLKGDEMDRFDFFLIFFLAVLLMGCGRRINVSSDYDRAANFHQYSTFTIEVEPQDRHDTGGRQSSFLDKRIAGFIEEEMVMRGYTYVSEDENPDLIVTFQRRNDQRREIIRDYYYGPPMGFWGGYRPYWGGPWTFGGPWGWGGMPYTRVQTFMESHLVINIFDARTDELVWQGWAIADARRERSYEDRVEGAREKVRRIMDEYQFRPAERVPQEETPEVRRDDDIYR